MRPEPMMIFSSDIPKGEPVETSLVGSACFDRVDGKKDSPRDEPDWDHGFRHHDQKPHKDVGVHPVLLQYLRRVGWALAASLFFNGPCWY